MLSFHFKVNFLSMERISNLRGSNSNHKPLRLYDVLVNVNVWRSHVVILCHLKLNLIRLLKYDFLEMIRNKNQILLIDYNICHFFQYTFEKKYFDVQLRNYGYGTRRIKRSLMLNWDLWCWGKLTCLVYLKNFPGLPMIDYLTSPNATLN